MDNKQPKLVKSITKGINRLASAKPPAVESNISFFTKSGAKELAMGSKDVTQEYSHTE